MTISARAVRTAGWALAGYGAFGIVLLVAALAIGSGPLATADRLLTSLDGTLDAAADTARSSSTALDSVESGLATARDGTRDAGRLVAEAAATSGGLAQAMTLSILGTQPLIGLADDFQAIAAQLDALGVSLGSVGDALDASRSDLGAVRADVDRLAAEVEAVRGAAGAGSDRTSTSLRLVYLALLAYLTLPAIGSLALGAALLRLARGATLSRPAA